MVMAAVQQDGCALYYAADALKADRELKTSVKKRGATDEEGAPDGKAAEAKRRAL